MKEANLVGERIQKSSVKHIDEEKLYEVEGVKEYHEGANYEYDVRIKSNSGSSHLIHVEDLGRETCALQKGDKIYAKTSKEIYNLKNI